MDESGNIIIVGEDSVPLHSNNKYDNNGNNENQNGYEWSARCPFGPASAREWMSSATVPGTALINLIQWNIFNEPWTINDNNHSNDNANNNNNNDKIDAPDIYDVGREYYCISYRLNIFSLRQLRTYYYSYFNNHKNNNGNNETVISERGRYWLVFTGINYNCDAIRVNGIDVITSNNSNNNNNNDTLPMKGMWTKRYIDLTNYLLENDNNNKNDNNNVIEIDASPCDHIGCCSGASKGRYNYNTNNISLVTMLNINYYCFNYHYYY